ncbi:hypothetical protein [Guyparkeria halopsychrophila]|uniref:hypothetical protein n=1 Tax=Guyparkeria halopsychrophila TaxID=3139421 RepID=UPI0037C60935
MQRRRVHQRVTLVIQVIMLAELAFALWEGLWLTSVMTVLILMLTVAPVLMFKRFEVFIPSELKLLATLFIFAALFLGEVQGYYTRFWWWDLVLHAASGFLLGIVGFLLVYILNEKHNIRFHMTPGFVALFAFMFALGIGALWEIFEFSMDQGFGTNMQKPMLGDPSGLTDTMWDLIVDAVGGGVIAVLGYGYLKVAAGRSFLEQWIASFLEANPRLFNRR